MSIQYDAVSGLHVNSSTFHEMPSLIFRNIVEQHIFLKQESARALLKSKQAEISQPDFSSLDINASSTVDGFDSTLITTSAKLRTKYCEVFQLG